MIVWDESYSMGIAEIDEQHKALFNFLNEFELLIKDKGGPQQFTAAIQFLDSYVKNHFCFEEDCMNKFKCTAAGKNKLSHKWFIEMMAGYVLRFEKEGYKYEMLLALHDTGEEWIKTHIIGIDTKLREYIDKP